MSRGTKPSGSQPSAISAVSLTLASVPVPSQIGSRGFMWRIGMSGLPTPSAPGPVYGSEISRPRVRDGLLALEHLAHDRDVIRGCASNGRPPRLAVPALDDLWAGDAEPGDDPAAAREPRSTVPAAIAAEAGGRARRAA